MVIVSQQMSDYLASDLLKSASSLPVLDLAFLERTVLVERIPCLLRR